MLKGLYPPDQGQTEPKLENIVTNIVKGVKLAECLAVVNTVIDETGVLNDDNTAWCLLQGANSFALGVKFQLRVDNVAILCSLRGYLSLPGIP